MRTKNEIFCQIKGGLIVSCQALKTEPLYSSFIMSRMAYAAMLGGAAGIRANTPEDITEIKKTVDLPVIGLYKQEFEGCCVKITPTVEAVDALIKVAPDIIAVDATGRLRPGSLTLEDFFKEIKEKYPDQLFMADCSCYNDAMRAAELGFDMVGTTLCSYTEETKGEEIPCYSLIHRLAEECSVPVVAEGGIWAPEQLRKAIDAGAFTAVVGTAITRPMEITKHYVDALQD